MQTGGQGTLDGENFTVGRVRKEVLGRSYIGAIVTNRQGNDRRNTLAGADARFTFFEHLNVQGLVARADDTRVSTSQWATQIGAEWRADFFEVGANYIDVDPEFNAGIGFVRFRERLVGTRAALKPRPGRWGIRQFETRAAGGVVSGSIAARSAAATSASVSPPSSRAATASTSRRSRASSTSGARFPIGPGVAVPPGEYDWNGVSVGVRTYNGRRMSGGATVSVGDFYDGTKTTVSLQADIRPGKLLSLAPTYSVNDVDHPRRRVRHAPGRRARQPVVLDQPADLAVRAVQQRRTTGGDPGAAQLHLPHDRQPLRRVQRHALHRGCVQGTLEPVAGHQGDLLTAPVGGRRGNPALPARLTSRGCRTRARCPDRAGSACRW